MHIITLFSGRWNTWEPYWQGLKELDYDRKSLELIWYSNASESFTNFLQYKASEAVKEGFKVKLYLDESVRPSHNAFVEKGERKLEHAITIASLYNSALKIIKDKGRIFFIEDDVYIPPHTLKYLIRDLNKNKDACYVAGVIFDRHEARIFAWDYEMMPKGYAEDRYCAFPPSVTWGVQSIGLSHLGCTLIDFRRIPKEIRRPIFRPQVGIEEAKQFLGCDIVFCFDVWKYRGKCLLDYRVRAFHYDSQARPH